MVYHFNITDSLSISGISTFKTRTGRPRRGPLLLLRWAERFRGFLLLRHLQSHLGHAAHGNLEEEIG